MHRLRVILGGRTNAFTPALVWDRNQRVQIFVSTSPLYAAYSVNGGAVRTVTLTPPMSMGALPALPMTIDLLCDGTNSQFSAWVRSIAAYNSGFRPTYP
jgi:hypothetical protein